MHKPYIEIPLRYPIFAKGGSGTIYLRVIQDASPKCTLLYPPNVVLSSAQRLHLHLLLFQPANVTLDLPACFSDSRLI